jgi:hypothetical protein
MICYSVFVLFLAITSSAISETNDGMSFLLNTKKNNFRNMS